MNGKLHQKLHQKAYDSIPFWTSVSSSVSQYSDLSIYAFSDLQNYVQAEDIDIHEITISEYLKRHFYSKQDESERLVTLELETKNHDYLSKSTRQYHTQYFNVDEDIWTIQRLF